MGEVYRARDTRLGREVAIKVLPAERASDPERRRRFEQEARSASALNHPNILTIHEVGSEGETTFIAMELVEGRTVRELVASGPVPTKKLLDVAAQTAEGLAKAHAAGIVHRDLKPENLMVSRDGYVKILDFGLAKLAEPDAHESSTIQTAAGSPTEPGTVLGTAGYMSPEQAAGRPVDFHSDQFALGSIVYEMATGQRAFQRKTGAETLVAIMREEPEPIAASSPAAPAPLRWIVERCLMKEPEDRYASTKDLARDLASVRDHLSETSVSAVSGGIEPAKTRRRGWLAPAAAALAGITAGFLLRGGLAGGKPALPQFQQVTYQRGMIFSARFAPDGQTIAYAAAWDGRPLEVYTARLDSPESRPLGLPSADVLSISKTGEMAISLDRHFLAGYESTGTLARVSLGGGAPRSVLENVQDADWAPDGQNFAVAHQVGNLQRVEYPIGKTIYTPSGWVSCVRVSPDGRFVAFIDHPTRGDNDGRLKVVDAEGKVRVEGPAANLGVAWSPRGDEIWSSGPLAVTTLSGKTRPLAAGAGIEILQDIAKDGRVLMSLVSARREIVGVPPGGGEERNLTWLNWSFPTDVTRDGRTVLFDEQNVLPPAVYLRPIDGSGPAVKLGSGYSFGLSPDGRFALNALDQAGKQLVLLPTGPGESRRLPPSNVATQAAAFFPDGRRILVTGSEPGRGVRLYVQELPDGKPRAITPEGVTTVRTISPVSPDGKLIAAYGPDAKLALYPVEPGEPRPVPGMSREDVPVRWTADGRALYLLRQSAPPGKIEMLDLATGRRTPWKELRPPDPAGILQVGPVVIAPDGSSFVYSYRRLLDELYVVTDLGR